MTCFVQQPIFANSGPVAGLFITPLIIVRLWERVMARAQPT